MPPTYNLSSLTDKELTDRLKAYGVNMGPIVQSTRNFYERKLAKLEHFEVVQPRYEEVPDDESEEEEEEHFELQEEVEPAPSRPSRNEPRRRVAPATPPRVTRQMKPEVSERVTSRITTRTAETSSKTMEKTSKSSSFAVWKILLVLIILAGFCYLVVINMEPEAESNIPNQIETEV